MQTISDHAGFSSDIITQNLPFVIQEANTPELLELASKTRKDAYGKHVPELAKTFRDIEPDDLNPDFTVMLALSKLDRSCIGTIRVQISNHKKLSLEESLQLPVALRQKPIAEVSRLAIPAPGHGLALRLMLMKSSYWFCRLHKVNVIFLCARSPVDRQYQRFGFSDVFAGSPFYPMKHIGHIEHRIFWFDIKQIANEWRSTNHPLLQTFILTYHPDILKGIQSDCLRQESVESSKVQTHASSSDTPVYPSLRGGSV